jgi:hypothetical protein
MLCNQKICSVLIVLGLASTGLLLVSLVQRTGDGLAIAGSLTPVETASSEFDNTTTEGDAMPQPKLRHVVLFQFKQTSSQDDIDRVVQAFRELPKRIPEIADFEFGTNNSPEGLDDGFTHCFLVTFRNEKDREVYLPHPDHLSFVEILKPHLEKVLVVDYWTNN